MSPENNRSDDYWMGVRDALRMVDSFIRWSSVNEDRAKPIQEFIHDGLIAAARRCESCLHKTLGINFDIDDSDEGILEDAVIEDDEIEDEVVKEDSLDVSYDSSPPEIILEPEGTSTSEDVPILIESEITEIPPESSPSIVTTPDDESVYIESMGIQDGSFDDDTHVVGAKRDFTSDFELIEPDPLIIRSTTEPEETDFIIDDTTSEESEVSDAGVDEAIERSDDDSRSISSWEESYRPPADALQTKPDEDSISASKKVWSPMDEPSSDELDADSEMDDHSMESPPPPPPPPETEESEDERRRRARRLFFGG